MQFPETISDHEAAKSLAAFIDEHVPRAARGSRTTAMNMLVEWVGNHHTAVRDLDELLRVTAERQLVFGYPFALAEVRNFLATSSTQMDVGAPPEEAASIITAPPSASKGPSTDEVLWLVPNVPWLSEQERFAAAAAGFLQPRRILRTIDDGLMGITLAELFDAEYRVGDYPPDLWEFSTAMLRLVSEERARGAGSGDRLRWQQAETDVRTRYPAALRRALELFSSVEPKSQPAFQHALLKVVANDHERVPTTTGANNVAITSIEVAPARRAQANADNVAALVQSIKDSGLINPITITPTGELVSGLHRLLACEALGMRSVPVFVRDVVGQKKRLAEIDENLVRRQLPALELAELTLERQHIYEAIHPEARQYKRGGHRKATRAATAFSAVAASFATDTAKRTGMAERTIRQYGQVAKMPSAVKDAVRKTPVASRINDLVALARLPDAEQMAVAKIIADGRAKGVSAARGLVAPAATSMPYPLAQAKTMVAQLEALRRMRMRASETLEEWQDKGHPDMPPYTDYWRGLIAALDDALFRPPPIPELCPCSGTRSCSRCAGRGWVAAAGAVLTPTSGAARPSRGRS